MLMIGQLLQFWYIRHRVTSYSPPPLFSKPKKNLQRYEMPLSLINGVNAPVPKNKRQNNFGRFVKLEQSKTGSKLRVFQN